MKKEFPISYQLLAEFLIASIIFTSAVFVFLPRPAKASFVFAWEVNPVAIIDFITSRLKEWVGDPLIYAITSQILNNIAMQTFNWIQTGQIPSFVRDWRAFLLDAGNRAFFAFNTYFTQRVLPGVDPAYQPLLAQLVSTNPFNPINLDIRTQLRSTLGSLGITPTVLSTYSGDFKAGGGWRTFAALLEPNNSFYNAYLQSLNAQARVVATLQEADRSEALAGGGFVGKKDPLTGEVKTPGATLQDAVKTAILEGPIGKFENADEISEFLVALLLSALNRLVTQGLQ